MPFADYKYHTGSTLRSSLLWEYDMSAFDWQAMRNIVVQRVLERGRRDDYYAILNMYKYRHLPVFAHFPQGGSL